ncbi:hypothetical protein [Citrobacter portucalensis]|uniref:hypothetical protein n=1 Tax=Citrobacter portucalensis TaxID=1639133 RepID=UPI00226B1F27|nr:hypothetical protein [Citrobacter portucalensis]MCX9044696.1 hypothetical protein [Citrobacter portucalensis]
MSCYITVVTTPQPHFMGQHHIGTFGGAPSKSLDLPAGWQAGRIRGQNKIRLYLRYGEAADNKKPRIGMDFY